MRGGAAHHAGVRADDDEVEPDPAEDPLVGPPVVLVLLVQPRLVPVERVGVLHRELADPDQSAAGARLVTPLGLDVIDDHRQLAVGADLLPRQVGHDLLVGHRQHHVAVAAVLEPGQLRPHGVVSARLPPDVGRMDDRHQQLLPADGVHLLADDLLDLAHDPPAQRQQAVDARAQRSHQRGAQHQTVAGQLDVARRLAQRPAEQV